MALGNNILDISEAVERYMAISGNNSPSFKAQYLIRGIFVWNDIRDNILKTTTHKWVRVDKSKLPYRVELPNCASKFLSVGAKNFCGEYKSFGKYNNMATVDEEEVETCTCDDKLKECIITKSKEVEVVTIGDTDYNKTTETDVCSNGDIMKKVTFPLEVLSNQLKYTFTGLMQILITDPDLEKYSDAVIAGDTQWHDSAITNIHYYNGIYDSDGNSKWKNSGIEDMFRGLYISTDVGISGHSNRGINEIGGHQADSIDAFTEWKVQFKNHIEWQLSKNGINSNVTITDGTTTTDSTKILRGVNIEIVAKNTADLEILMLNSNTIQEFDLADASPVSGWHYDDIKITDSSHKYMSTITDVDSIVEMKTETELICNLAVKPCGCIEVSQENMNIIDSCMCEPVRLNCNDICQNYFKQPNDDSLICNDAGYYKYEDGKRTVFLYGDIPGKVLLNYKSNGEIEEYMPEYCLSCFYAGMNDINSRYSKTMNRFEKAQAKQEYWDEKNKLEIDLPRNMLSTSQWDNNKIGIFVKW